MKKTLLLLISLLGINNLSNAQAALNFNGSNGYVVSNSPLVHGNTFTYEAMVNISDPADWEGIITTSTTSGQSNFVQMSVNNNGNLRVEISNGSSSVIFDGATSLEDAWHHVAVTYNGTNLKLYVDGILDGTNNTSISPLNINAEMYIGAERFKNLFLHATIDDVRIWNVVRTQAEIQDNIGCALTTATGLIANYNFNEGVADADNTAITTLNDISGNNFNASIINFILNGSGYSNFVNNAPVLNATSVISSDISSVFVGGTVTFSATPVYGGSAPVYQWMKNSNPVGSNSATYSTSSLVSSDVFTCMITSSNTCVAGNLISNSVSVTVNSLPAGNVPLFGMRTNGSSDDNTLYVLDSVSFDVVNEIPLHGSLGEVIIGNFGLATSKTGVIYSLLKIQGEGSTRFLATINPNDSVATVVATLTDNFAGLAWAGDSLYGVTGHNGGGSSTTTSPSSLFKIDHITGASTFITAFYDQYGQTIAYCKDNNALYQFGGSSGTNPDDKHINKINPNYPYNVTAITPSGYDWSEVLSAVYIGAGKFAVQTWNEFTIIDTNGVAVSSSLYYDNYYKGMTFPKYLITRVGPSAICVGDSSLLKANMSGGTYQWYKNNVLISGATSQNYYAKTAGSYNCKYSIALVSNMAETPYSITVNALPVVTVSGATEFCTGGSATLNGSSGGTSQWYLNGNIIPGANSPTYNASALGVYNMTKTNTNGCSDSAAVGITVDTENASPTVTASSDALNNTVCEGSDITLMGGGADSYVWDNSVTDNTAFALTDTMTYTVTGTENVNGCTNTASITVYTLPLPNVTATSDATNDAVCEGSDITLMGDGADSYVWDNSVTNNTAFALTDTMTYTVTGTDVNGCENTKSITVYTLPLPTVTASSDAAGNVVCTGNPVTLTGGGADSYVWDNSVTDGIAFTPADTADYTVTGTDANGCTNTATITVYVDLCTGLAANNSAANLSIYPNPTTGNVTITTSGTVANSIKVFDVVGNFVANVLVTSETTNINLSTYADGVYVVKVRSNNTTQNIRIVKAN